MLIAEEAAPFTGVLAVTSRGPMIGDPNRRSRPSSLTVLPLIRLWLELRMVRSMAEDDQDRARETRAEREAEITSEMERVDQDPDQVNEGSDSLGAQNAPSGTPREAETADAGDEGTSADEDANANGNGEENTDEDGNGDVRRATDPTLLRSVIEERSGYPAHVPQSEGQGDQGLLRVGFRDRDEDLKEISWEEFTEEIREKDLVGLYTEDGSAVDGDRPVVLRSHAEDD